jgi:hypothetical protein
MTQITLRHGIFLPPFHPMEENPTACLDRDLELMVWLDRLGFHEAWIGEHHSAGFEIIGSPEIFIAIAAERTKFIRFGTGVISLPYHNPLMVADRIVQLDHHTNAMQSRRFYGGGSGNAQTGPSFPVITRQPARTPLEYTRRHPRSAGMQDRSKLVSENASKMLTTAAVFERSTELLVGRISVSRVVSRRRDELSQFCGDDIDTFFAHLLAAGASSGNNIKCLGNPLCLGHVIVDTPICTIYRLVWGIRCVSFWRTAGSFWAVRIMLLYSSTERPWSVTAFSNA